MDRLQTTVNLKRKRKGKEAKLIFARAHLSAVCVLTGLTPEPSLGDLPGKPIVYFDLLPFLRKER